MPEVGQEIIVRINFPEYPVDNPGWVDVVCNPMRSVFLESESSTENKDAVIMSKVIKKWNFTEKGETLPITAENVERCLAVIDRVLVLQKIGLASLFDDVKKNV